jgi:hypothetical protein
VNDRAAPRVSLQQVDRLVEQGKVLLPARGALVEPYGRWAEVLAALRWCLASWRKPADHAARWEQ